MPLVWPAVYAAFPSAAPGHGAELPLVLAVALPTFLVHAAGPLVYVVGPAAAQAAAGLFDFVAARFEIGITQTLPRLQQLSA